MNAYEQIGRKIQKAREEAGMNQEELASKIGCTQASLSNYELGKRRLYLADLQRIGRLLGKQVTYFVEDPDEENLDDDDIKKILKDPYLKKILFSARDLDTKQRQAVLEYIQWKKDRSDKKGGKHGISGKAKKQSGHQGGAKCPERVCGRQ